MVLSKDGSPDIYLMNLASRRLTRLTQHYAIDTEPTWMPDGKSLLFTSDRGGRPQIYRYDLKSGKTTRVTFEGRYNARARVAQDGRNVALVHQRAGAYHIAVHDLVTERLTVLTTTDLDESPTIAPNGSVVLNQFSKITFVYTLCTSSSSSKVSKKSITSCFFSPVIFTLFKANHSISVEIKLFIFSSNFFLTL